MSAKKGKLSRRTMLAGLAIGTGVAGAASLAALRTGALRVADPERSWWGAPPVALENAAASAWAEKIGETFDLSSPDDGGSYRLAAVQPMLSSGERPDDVARQRAFALVFEACGDTLALGNRTYDVKHSGGALEIFFAVAAPESPNRLVAVFN